MSRLTVIVGEDDYLVAEAAKKAILPDGALEVVDSLAASNAALQLKDLAAAEASFATPPFLEPAKTTWWKNVHFLPQGAKAASAEDVKVALERFAKKLAAAPMPENQSFILSAPKLLQTSVFAKTLKTAAEMIVFAEPRNARDAARQTASRVESFARREGLSLEGRVLEAFVARVGSDTRTAMNELAKLRAYVGPDRSDVTAEDLAAVTSAGIGVEPVIWDVTDAIGERDVARALQAVRRFEGQNGFAVMMTTVCERFFRQLAVLKDAQTRRRLDEATKGMNPYVARKNAGFLSNWSLVELRVAWRRFAALRERCVSTAGESDVLVVAEVARACLPARKGVP